MVNNNDLVTTLEAVCKALTDRLDQQNELLYKVLNKETVQEIVPMEHASDYLGKGWKYVGSFCDGSSYERKTYVVVEIDKERRR